MADIRWSSEFDRDKLLAAGLSDFDSFWNLEQSGATAEYKPVRQHYDRKTGRMKKQTTIVRINKIRYYLKRASGDSYKFLKNEFETLKILPDFGLNTAKLLAYCLDDQDKRGFLLYKSLSGYNSLEELNGLRAQPEAIASFKVHKKDILRNIASAVNAIHHAGYFYPDWVAGHIFIRKGSQEVVLIDLERFVHLKKCPWYYKYRVIRNYARMKEWRKIRTALGSKMYTRKFLNRLLREKN
ncbi:MAG TPA: hypothetical protein DCZ94_19380 [Lentisphaeria bacterium]|nr:MAG: hypothetical protein A2X48_07525 [Lentisphaerae bacterium GWF2_49_21]HBC89106.1 hypothetical protein [Lentisphaeria bacterium]